jgi:hypothetical protein
MMKKLALITIPLAIAGGFFLVMPSFFVEKTIAAPPSQSIDTWQLERDASKQTTRSFDDEYQMHLGVLDELRP